DDRHRSVDVSGLASHQVVARVEDLHREISECHDGLLGHLPHIADDSDWPTALPDYLGFNPKEPRGNPLRRVVSVRYAGDHGIDRLEVESLATPLDRHDRLLIKVCPDQTRDVVPG